MLEARDRTETAYKRTLRGTIYKLDSCRVDLWIPNPDSSRSCVFPGAPIAPHCLPPHLIDVHSRQDQARITPAMTIHHVHSAASASPHGGPSPAAPLAKALLICRAFPAHREPRGVQSELIHAKNWVKNRKVTGSETTDGGGGVLEGWRVCWQRRLTATDACVSANEGADDV